MKNFVKLTCVGLFCLLTVTGISAQIKGSENDGWRNRYRSTAEKVNDLVHTKLDVKFDYNRSYMYGKEWLTLKPHFYKTDSLRLDAKGMEIKRVGIYETGKVANLRYTYENNMQLLIKLNKSYGAGEQYTVFIDYVAKPNELKAEGSAAITDAKGLYFINPTG